MSFSEGKSPRWVSYVEKLKKIQNVQITEVQLSWVCWLGSLDSFFVLAIFLGGTLPCSEEHVYFSTEFWVVVSNIVYFHHHLGKIPILTNIVQRGWNHQLEFGTCWISDFLDLTISTRYLLFDLIWWWSIFCHLLAQQRIGKSRDGKPGWWFLGVSKYRGIPKMDGLQWKTLLK